MKQCLVYAVLAFAALGTPDLFAAQTRFTSTDSIVTVEVPQSWSTLFASEEADLQVGNEADEIYFMAFNERNVDLFGWNLARHSLITLGQLVAGVDFPEITGPVEVTVGGFGAVQYFVQGASEGFQVAYLHTTVDGPDVFIQILAWTLRSRWERNEGLLRDVLESVEIRATAPTQVPDIRP